MNDNKDAPVCMCMFFSPGVTVGLQGVCAN